MPLGQSQEALPPIGIHQRTVHHGLDCVRGEISARGEEMNNHRKMAYGQFSQSPVDGVEGSLIEMMMEAEESPMSDGSCRLRTASSRDLLVTTASSGQPEGVPLATHGRGLMTSRISIFRVSQSRHRGSH